jgi:hypothetical protein
MNELETFLCQTAAILDASESITELGVSRTLSVELNYRVVEIATNGPMLWLVADFEWPGFPTDGTSISWAPAGSVLRIKLLEGPVVHSSTGDTEFDDIYIIQGPRAGELSNIPPQALRVLLANQHLHPHLTGREISLEPSAIRRRKHIRCDPDLFEDPSRPGYVRLGSELYTPSNAARWAEELSRLVISLQSAFESQALDG